MKFRTVTDEIPTTEVCPRCAAAMIRLQYSDGETGPVICSENEHHNGVLCRRLGHTEGWANTERCDMCGGPVQWVRVEVREGKAYTYMAFEDRPLERGESVILPGNVVRSQFTGRVLRVLDAPDAEYAGPYKAVIRRACSCRDGYDNACSEHGGLL